MSPRTAPATVPPHEVGGGVSGATRAVSVGEGSGAGRAGYTGAESDGGGTPGGSEMAGAEFVENPAGHVESGRNAGLLAAVAKRKRPRGRPFTSRSLYVHNAP